MSAEIEENFAIVGERWPLLYQRLTAATPDYRMRWEDSGAELTLEVEGYRMWSGYDAVREAALQAARIPEESPVAWVYGIGGGDTIRALLARGSIQRLNVVPMNIGLTSLLFRLLDQRDWLADPRVELLDYHKEAQVCAPFAVIPPCLRLSEPEAHTLRDSLALELASEFNQKRFAWIRASRAKQIEDNIPLIEQDGDVDELFAEAMRRRVFVAAAGPSLLGMRKWIAGHRREAYLISVDGALRPLLDAGVVPDLVVSADHFRDGVLRYFSTDLSECARSTLVYLPVVHRDVLERWPGRRLTAYTDDSLYDDLKQRIPKGDLSITGGSVLHCAVEIAVRMGAQEIVLFGADFSFPGGRQHADDAANDAGLRQGVPQDWVVNGIGQRNPTMPNLRGYLMDLERYIALHPQIRFINSSRLGARIAGTRYLEDAAP